MFEHDGNTWFMIEPSEWDIKDIKGILFNYPSVFEIGMG